MLTIREKFNNLIKLAKEKTAPYVYSYFLPVLTSIIILLFWVADLQLIGFAIIALMASFIFVVYDDFLPIVPFIFSIPMCFRNPSLAISNSLVIFIIILSVLVLSIVFHFIRYSIKITFDGYGYMLLGIFALFLFAGIFAGGFSNYFKAIDLMMISTLMPLAIHVFFYNKIKLNDKIDYRKYFCFCFICAITLASMQLIYAFAYIKLIGPWSYGNMPGGFCWANSNHIASLILIAVPLCCYMMVSSKNLFCWFLELFFLYLTMLISGSDGALATLIIFTPFLMYALHQNAYKHNRKFLYYAYFALLSFAVLALALLCLFFFDKFWSFVMDSSSGNGRAFPYEVALQNFLKQPIFGVGFGNGRASLDLIKATHDTNGFFHSTLFHILACAGIFGVLVYVVYYVVRIKYLAKSNTVLGHFSLFSFLMFGTYGMIENNEFNIVLLFMAMIITIVGLINKKGSGDRPLPLFVKNIKF